MTTPPHPAPDLPLATAGTAHENPAIPLNRRYWCALGLIAALIVFHQVLLQPALSQLTSDAPVINIAGRQRMLSQKLSKAALALEAAGDPTVREARRAELREILQEWSQSHRGLQYGDAELRLPGTNPPQIAAAFADLELHFTAIVGAVEDLLSASRDIHALEETSPTRASAIERILVHEVEFLTRMHAIVGQYEDEARQHIAQLQTLSFVVMVAILGTLLVVQFVVVRPAVRGVGREFEQSEAQYQRLVESMSDGLVVHDPQERVLFANQRFCEMVGYSVTELTGAPAALYVADGDRRRYDELGQRIAGDNAPSEITLKHRDGRSIETIISSQLLSDPNGGPQGFLLVVTDITARREAEQRNRELAEQLAHADRLKSMGELATGLAHEINQPLGAIANYAEGCLATLAADPTVSPELREPLQRILRAALRGGEIIRRARSFSRPQPQDIVPTQINDLVSDIEQLCSIEARRRGIEVRLELSPELPAIAVDAIQIQQVLANLIQNAFAALEDTSEFRRRLFIQTQLTDDGSVEIAVHDTGSGIESHLRERIFEPFFTTRKEGTGMGLAIVRGIVEAHGGTIVVEPNRDGGSTFLCRLPVDGEAIRARAPQQIVSAVVSSRVSSP